LKLFYADAAKYLLEEGKGQNYDAIICGSYFDNHDLHEIKKEFSTAASFKWSVLPKFSFSRLVSLDIESRSSLDTDLAMNIDSDVRLPKE
jgi:hypothetical protein